MKTFLKKLSRNKLYVILVVFILGINLLTVGLKTAQDRIDSEQDVTLQEEQLDAVVPETAVVEEKEPVKMFDIEDARARQKKFEALSKENPKVYLFIAFFNLLVLFLIFVGMVFDGYLLGRFFKKQPINIRVAPEQVVNWSVWDIVKVGLIFLSFGYIVIIIQGFLAGLIPIIQNENFMMIFNTLIMNAVAIGVLLYFVIKKRKQHIAAIGITSKSTVKCILYGFVGYIALLPVVMVIMVVTFFVTQLIQYEPPLQPIVEVILEEKQTFILWFSTIFAAIFGPIAEEVFFRGFAYPAIRKKVGIFWGMIIISSIFALLHAHIVGFLPIMALGMLLVYLYEKTGSIVPCITVHIIHNLGMVFMVFLMRYMS